MSEEWRPVVGFEGLYEVSDLGRVRSLDRVVWCEGPVKGRYPSRKSGRILRPGRMGGGHLSVMLGREGGSRLVHHIVLAAFVGPLPDGREVRHLNGEPGDNRLANLAYGTRSQNTQDKKWHKGASTYKLRPPEVGEIKRALRRGVSGASLARAHSVSQSNISSIKHGKIHRDVCAYD